MNDIFKKTIKTKKGDIKISVIPCPPDTIHIRIIHLGNLLCFTSVILPEGDKIREEHTDLTDPSVKAKIPEEIIDAVDAFIDSLKKFK